MKTSTKSVVSLLKSDDQVKRLEKLFNTLPMFSIPKEALIEEIESAHASRKVRRLQSEKGSSLADSLLAANIQDQAIRSRMSEILMTCLKARTRLEASLKSLRNHLLLEHASLLRQFKTKDERLNLLNIVMRKYVKYLDALEAVQKLSEYVVVDIDKAGYALERNIKILELHTRREHRI